MDLRRSTKAVFFDLDGVGDEEDNGIDRKGGD
jgi:hypothetical protein